MKLLVERQELKGPFGGTYYKSTIEVKLRPEEKEAARQQCLLEAPLLGGFSEEAEETAVSYMCRKLVVTLKDLETGITAKIHREWELEELAWFENTVRKRCQTFKSILDKAIATQESLQGCYSFEEEL